MQSYYLIKTDEKNVETWEFQELRYKLMYCEFENLELNEGSFF